MWEEEEEIHAYIYSEGGGQGRQTIQAHCSSTQVAAKGDGDHHKPGEGHMDMGHGNWVGWVVLFF